MDFKIYGRNFHDEVIVVGSREVANPQYDGKAYPCIEVLKNTGEIMDTRLIAKDSEYWADAYRIRIGDPYNFILQALEGKENISKMLEEIISK